MFNAQTVITPADYAAGTTFDAMFEGTGPWKLETYDQSTSARFVRNDAWWGGATPLDAVEWVFFDETGPMVSRRYPAWVSLLSDAPPRPRHHPGQRRPRLQTLPHR